MQLIRSFSRTPHTLKHAVIALGNFDGLHLGHQAILRQTLALAKSLKAPAAVMSFEPHPREFFKPNAPKLRLMRTRDKILTLRTMGFDALFLPRFTAALAATEAEDFIQNILCDQLAAQHIITGDNFCFGKNRKGNSQLLTLSSIHGKFGYSAIAAVEQEQKPVSSSAIREALSHGDTALAALLLGSPFFISGHVAHGDKRGRTIGFPTANITLKNLFIPKLGVYAVRAHIGNTSIDGVANLGIRPTFAGTYPRLETHLFNFDQEIYGQPIRVNLLTFIRAEQHFTSLDEMTAQLKADSATAKHLLSA
jgi:riboflavin kinase/FMN adenylyltransferase